MAKTNRHVRQMKKGKAMTLENAQQRRIRILTTALDDINNREDACCPEDVAFDEYIKTLQAENKHLESLLADADADLLELQKSRLDKSKPGKGYHDVEQFYDVD